MYYPEEDLHYFAPGLLDTSKYIYIFSFQARTSARLPQKHKMYLCVRQITVIIEKTTPMARPRSTLRTTTDNQVTTQTIYTKTGAQ